MLFLIHTDRHKIGIIEQNIGSHERRIGKQSSIYIVCVLLRFILKLSHSSQLSVHSIAIKYPCKLGMSGNMALNKNKIFFQGQHRTQVRQQE